MKNKIKNIGRITKGKFSSDELNEIHNLTSFIETDNLSERCYYIINDITAEVKCKECGINIPVFLRISSGYREFCSHNCKNNWVYKNTDAKERISKSSKESYNKFSKKEIREQQNKRLLTMVERNIITDISERELKYHYSREVWRFTNTQNIKSLENYDKRGVINIEGSYQLDHMYSIHQGFKDNIPPWIIGNIVNLVMIPSRENSSKRQKCSITKKELINKFDREVTKL